MLIGTLVNMSDISSESIAMLLLGGDVREMLERVLDEEGDVAGPFIEGHLSWLRATEVEVESVWENETGEQNVWCACFADGTVVMVRGPHLMLEDNGDEAVGGCLAVWDERSIGFLNGEVAVYVVGERLVVSPGRSQDTWL